MSSNYLYVFSWHSLKDFVLVENKTLLTEKLLPVPSHEHEAYHTAKLRVVSKSDQTKGRSASVTLITTSSLAKALPCRADKAFCGQHHAKPSRPVRLTLLFHTLSLLTTAHGSVILFIEVFDI